MALPSGLAGQIGLTKETTYGQHITPATFFPFINESIDIEPERIESESIIAGRRVLTSGQWTPGNVKVGGDVGFELYDRGVGKLFEQMLGSVATTGSGPYTHTIRPSTTGLPSATWQIGRPANDGTVYPVNLTGAKVGSWELACKVGEIATLGLTLVARNGNYGSRSVSDGVTTNTSTTVTSSTGAFSDADRGKIITGTGIPSNTTIAFVNSSTSIELSAAATATGSSIALTIGAALASASYASSQTPLKATRASLTIGGSESYATEITIKGDNSFAAERRYLGSDLIREPIPADLAMYTADIKAEFDSQASYDALRAGSEAALSLVLTSPANSSYSVTISGNCRYDKASTNVAGRGILEKDISVKFVASTSNDYSAIQAVLVNGDSAV